MTTVQPEPEPDPRRQKFAALNANVTQAPLQRASHAQNFSSPEREMDYLRQEADKWQSFAEVFDNEGREGKAEAARSMKALWQKQMEDSMRRLGGQEAQSQHVTGQVPGDLAKSNPQMQQATMPGHVDLAPNNQFPTNNQFATIPANSCIPNQTLETGGGNPTLTSCPMPMTLPAATPPIGMMQDVGLPLPPAPPMGMMQDAGLPPAASMPHAVDASQYRPPWEFGVSNAHYTSDGGAQQWDPNLWGASVGPGGVEYPPMEQSLDRPWELMSPQGAACDPSAWELNFQGAACSGSGHYPHSTWDSNAAGTFYTTTCSTQACDTNTVAPGALSAEVSFGSVWDQEPDAFGISSGQVRGPPWQCQQSQPSGPPQRQQSPQRSQRQRRWNSQKHQRWGARNMRTSDYVDHASVGQVAPSARQGGVADLKQQFPLNALPKALRDAMQQRGQALPQGGATQNPTSGGTQSSASDDVHKASASIAAQAREYR